VAQQTASLPRPTGGTVVAGGLAALTGVLLAVGGPVAAAVPLVAVGVVALAARPRLLLLAYVAAIVLLEDDEEGFFPARGAFYDGAPSAADLLLVVLAAATFTWIVRERRPVLTPEPFTLALCFVAVAVAGGVVVGWSGGGDPTAIVNSLRAFVPLLVLPLVVVNLVDDERLLLRGLAVLAALAAAKGLEGVAAWATGAGRPLEGTTITFYEPAANFLLLLFVLGVAGAFLLKVPVPRWAYLALPFAAAALVLSYRRNFWIAGLLAFALLLLVSRLDRRRRLLLPTVTLVAMALVATLTWRGPTDLEGPVAERFTSLAPTRIATTPYDRYRLDEQRNVLAEIRRSPFLGIGLGVPWTVTQPLPVELEDGRLYTHTVALWYWLKLGLAGLVAYAWLVAATVVTAFAVARRSATPLVRVAALAIGVAAVGMVVAETTGSFTGVSDRYTVLVALLLGWLAAARRCSRGVDAPP
jgi:hypothetical protein